MAVVELLIRSEEVDGTKYKYFYRLIKREIAITSEIEGIIPTQSYGIEIERHDMVKDSLVNVERNSVYNVSTSRHKVHNILKYLFENTVSPVHLIDIVGQETDENVIDYNIRLAFPAER
jgi:Family of unknown function (DUF6514)